MKRYSEESGQSVDELKILYKDILCCEGDNCLIMLTAEFDLGTDLDTLITRQYPNGVEVEREEISRNGVKGKKCTAAVGEKTIDEAWFVKNNILYNLTVISDNERERMIGQQIMDSIQFDDEQQTVIAHDVQFNIESCFKEEQSEQEEESNQLVDLKYFDYSRLNFVTVDVDEHSEFGMNLNDMIDIIESQTKDVISDTETIDNDYFSQIILIKLYNEESDIGTLYKTNIIFEFDNITYYVLVGSASEDYRDEVVQGVLDTLQPIKEKRN